MKRMAATIAALAAALPATAAAAGPRQTFGGAFTTAVPGASSGYRLAIDYRDPANPGGKPYAVQRVLQQLHAGSRIDTTVPPRCTASDAQLNTQGASACPADTRVGTGELSVDFGQGAGRVPRVVETRVTVFNADRQVILFAESTNAGDPPIRVTSRSAAGERTFTSDTPPVPGASPSDPYMAIKRVRLSLDPVTMRGRAFIRTPPSCPASGAWTTTGTFTYRDGAVETVASQTPCSRASARRRDRWRPRIRIRGVPRRRCTARTFRARVRIGEHNPLRRAAASLGRRTLRSTRRKQFYVRVRASGLRRGRHRLAVVAVDAAGNRARRTVRFRRC